MICVCKSNSTAATANATFPPAREIWISFEAASNTGLDRFTFSPAAGKHPVFEQAAFQRAIEQWRAPAGLQPHAFRQCRVRTEEMTAPARPMRLQGISKLGIQFGQH